MGNAIDSLYKMGIEKSGDYGLSKANTKIQNLFRAPETFNRTCPRYSQTSSVYEFGLFLLYSSLDNLDFMKKSEEEILQLAITGNHPAVPAHCSKDLAHIIESCLCLEASSRPGFAEIRDSLLTLQIAQTKKAITTLQEDKNNLFSRVPSDLINSDLMKAIHAYGVFTLSNKSEPAACDNKESNTAAFK